MSRLRCQRIPRGSKRPCGAAFDVVTDRLGRDVSECPKCSRHERGLCRECPARIEGRARWCARCVGLRRLEDSRRFEAENRATRNARSRERERRPEVRARKRVNARAWRARHPDKVKAQKRRYLLKQSPTYMATQRRHNANPVRQEKKRAHALARYYERHPVRPDPKCRGCEARIEWTPPGRPPVNCDRCVPPCIARRRKSRHEPFAGSLAVLLGRPSPPAVETVNDLDCYLANFWRALAADPDQVAHFADGPVNEADLHARHRWLVSTGKDRVDRLRTDPDFFDAKVAGWWVWGQCLWIGSGWCAGEKHRNGRGGNPEDHAQRPQLSHDQALMTKRPALTGKGHGVGVHLRSLSERLRRVRVCCGDWQRVLGPAVTSCIGTSGIFLDPPYHAPRTGRAEVYTHETDGLWESVHTWAIANGDNPELRIALCGYEGGGAFPTGWTEVPWKSAGGYGSSARGRANRARERVWFSPHCLSSEQLELTG